MKNKYTLIICILVSSFFISNNLYAQPLNEIAKYAWNDCTRGAYNQNNNTGCANWNFGDIQGDFFDGANACGYQTGDISINVSANPAAGRTAVLEGFFFWSVSYTGNCSYRLRVLKDGAQIYASTYYPVTSAIDFPYHTFTGSDFETSVAATYTIIIENSGCNIHNVLCMNVYGSCVNTPITCNNVTFPGSIAGGGTQCTNYDPPNLNPTPATGGSGASIQYQWQQSFDGGATWSDISGQTGLAYNPGPLTQSTGFRRLAKRTDCTDWISSTELMYTIIQGLTNPGVITGGGQGCNPYDPPNITGTNASGGSQGSIEYQWQRSDDGVNFVNIGGATSLSYNPPPSITQTTHYKRRARRTVCTNWLESNVVVFNISNCCQIDATASNVQCNDNGTPSNPADDRFTFDLLVSGTGPGSTYTATAPGWSANGTIGQTLSGGPIAIGSGATVTITIDAGSGCTDQVSVAPPASCSNDCPVRKCIPFSVAKD